MSTSIVAKLVGETVECGAGNCRTRLGNGSPWQSGLDREFVVKETKYGERLWYKPDRAPRRDHFRGGSARYAVVARPAGKNDLVRCPKCEHLNRWPWTGEELRALSRASRLH